MGQRSRQTDDRHVELVLCEVKIGKTWVIFLGLGPRVSDRIDRTETPMVDEESYQRTFEQNRYDDPPSDPPEPTRYQLQGERQRGWGPRTQKPPRAWLPWSASRLHPIHQPRRGSAHHAPCQHRQRREKRKASRCKRNRCKYPLSKRQIVREQCIAL